MLIVTFCHQYMKLWVPGKEVITQGMGTVDTAFLPWVCSGNVQCEPREDPPRWPPGLVQWSHRWWTAPLETNQCIIWKQQWMWTWLSDSRIKIHGEPLKLSKFSTVRWTNEEKELALLTSLSEELPELHFAPDLAAAAEKPTSSCSCSRGEFSFPHYLCLTDCSSLYIPPPIPPRHPPFLYWLTALWFPNSFCIGFHRSPYTLVRVPVWQTPPAVVPRTFQESNDLAPFASVKGMQLFQTHEGDVVLWGINNRQACRRDLCVKLRLMRTVKKINI